MRVRIVVALALFLIGFNIVTMGGIGYYLLAAGYGILGLVFGGEIFESIHGGFSWPAIIWVGILWPAGVGIVWCVMLTHKDEASWSLKKRLLFLGFPIVYDVLLSALVLLDAALFSITDVNVY
jgi:hypothetical protein